MSQSELERFIADVKANKEMQEDLKKGEASVEAVVKYAKEKGYDFTVEELKAYVETKKSELSEEELEKIAGGIAAAAIQVVAGAGAAVVVALVV